MPASVVSSNGWPEASLRYRAYSTEHQINTGSDPLSEILEHRFIGELEILSLLDTYIQTYICLYVNIM